MVYDADYLMEGDDDEPPQLVESGDVRSNNNDLNSIDDSSVPITILSECVLFGFSSVVSSVVCFSIFYCLPCDLPFQCGGKPISVTLSLYHDKFPVALVEAAVEIENLVFVSCIAA